MIKKEIRYILITGLISLIICNFAIPASAAVRGQVMATSWNPVTGEITITVNDADGIVVVNVGGKSYPQEPPKNTVTIPVKAANKDFPLTLTYGDKKRCAELWLIQINGDTKREEEWRYSIFTGKGLSIIGIIGLTGILIFISIIRVKFGMRHNYS